MRFRGGRAYREEGEDFPSCDFWLARRRRKKALWQESPAHRRTARGPECEKGGPILNGGGLRRGPGPGGPTQVGEDQEKKYILNSSVKKGEVGRASTARNHQVCKSLCHAFESLRRVRGLDIEKKSSGVPDSGRRFFSVGAWCSWKTPLPKERRKGSTQSRVRKARGPSADKPRRSCDGKSPEER